jgi:2-hydroxychromene-2-carboxylate isomerase
LHLIEFFFDFASPYGYLASHVIEAVGERTGRPVVWKPILLGAAMKETGAVPLLTVPMKGDYARHDAARAARRLGVPLVVPETFPFASVAACRAYYALVDKDPDAAKALARALYATVFAEGKEISRAETVLETAASTGIDAEALAGAMASPEIKGQLRREVTEAIERGVFGSPFIFADGEPFWGFDRLGEVEVWLREGAW